MGDENFQYEKPKGARGLLPTQPKSTSTFVGSVVKVKENIPLKYKKEDGTKEVPTFIVVFSGGEVRERDYFSLIQQNQGRFPKIKLEFLAKSYQLIKNKDPKKTIKPNEGGFSPDKLYIFAKYWIDERYIKPSISKGSFCFRYFNKLYLGLTRWIEDKYMTSGKSALFLYKFYFFIMYWVEKQFIKPIIPIDSIYMISDIDHFVSELKRIKPLCQIKQIKLVMSNSCFEKWLYYGYFSKKPTEHTNPFSCPSNLIEISSAFKTYCATIIKGGLNPKKSLYNLENAIVNAETNYSEDKNGVPTLYSTNMFILGKELYPLIKQELDLIQQDIEAKSILYRNQKP